MTVRIDIGLDHLTFFSLSSVERYFTAVFDHADTTQICLLIAVKLRSCEERAPFDEKSSQKTSSESPPGESE